MFQIEAHLGITGIKQAKQEANNALIEYKRAWNAEMMRLALVAYFKQGGDRFPCKYLSHVAEHEDIHCVCLNDDTGILAIYRISGYSSFGRKAKRWPKAIEEVPVSRQGIALYAAYRKAGLVNHHMAADPFDQFD